MRHHAIGPAAGDSHQNILGARRLRRGAIIAERRSRGRHVLRGVVKHDRVTHVHIKDRKANNGPNMPFGQGDTPIKEILLMMKKEKYTFPATIELEYELPADSDAVKEVAKCVQYCKEALA